MGIPKFFRFISERWPTISQLVDGNQMAEFDNLYLDMNSILHTCTHSNDGTISRMTDDQMYAAIFKYIEHLFEIIKPKDTFYMAIDGVAPRAKMNQQRARRFRTAYEAEENLKKAIEQGLEIPKDDPFDSNSITPGTEFMAKLTKNLKYFIHKKVTEDSNWSNINIILSGHEVPGEGEHKIMDYIRSMKSQPEYNPDKRHCVYGLDADLIMLGLVSHDPHFALLREEVTFGPRSQSKSNDLNDQKFFLLHISLLREYLSLEFEGLDNQLNFEYDFERILDDFILISYVIGNDFLPNLPDLFINEGAFPLLIRTFKDALLEMDGYINERGTINLKRLLVWLKKLSHFELENFEKKDVDIEWFNKKLEDISITGEKKREQLGKVILNKDEKKLIGYIRPWLLGYLNYSITKLSELDTLGQLHSLSLNKNYDNEFILKNLEFIKSVCLELGLLIVHSKSNDTYDIKLDLDGINPSESLEEYNARVNSAKKIFKKYQGANVFENDEFVQESKDIYNKKFMDWKDGYYKDKLHFSIYETDKLVEMTKHYIEGLQWVLYYYYKGCQSWNWYYRYHYAPRISDIIVGLEDYIAKDESIKLEMSKPFKPFEQLMAVLPARSKALMPIVYRNLMTDPTSPIHDFYPDEVDIDLNGKKASWEAVVLLSFVDEKKLIKVLEPIEALLNPEEKARNSFGTDIKFIFNPQFNSIYPSPLPGFFEDLEHDKCHEESFVLPKVDSKDIKIGLIENAKFGVESLAGFPTLMSVPFESGLLLNETKVFQNASRSESMVLKVKNIWSEYTAKQFSDKFLGEVVYSRWPYLRESKVLEINDGETKYSLIEDVISGTEKVVEEEVSGFERKEYENIINNLNYTYMKTKAVELHSKIFVKVCAVNGLMRYYDGSYKKTFSRNEEYYPIELIVEEVVNKDERYRAKPPRPIEEEFPINSQAIFLGAFGYGSPSLIVGHSGDKSKLSIKVHKIDVEDEITIGTERKEIESREIKYYPSFDICRSLGINALFLSKLTSGFMIENDLIKGGRRVNVGLELKFDAKRIKVLGYTEKNGKFWTFSPWAIKLVEDYKSKFPNVFRKLKEVQGRDIPKASALGIQKGELEELVKWLKETKSSLIQVSLESKSLTKFSYSAIEKHLIESINSGKFNKFANKDIKGVPREAVLKPSESYQLLNTQEFELGDRVVYVQDFGKVPYLSKGTVVSITVIATKVELGVIFDYPLLSGNNMNGKLKTNRGLTIETSFVLNLTNKQLIFHSQASKGKPVKNVKPAAKAKSSKENGKPKEASKPKTITKDNQNKLKEETEKLTTDSSINSSQSKEILNLINSKVKPSDVKTEGDSNAQAIKQIYGHIYNNIMNDGQQPVAPMPQQIPKAVIPVVPGVPIPPHLLNQPLAQQEPKVNGARGGRGNSRGRGGANRGRGGANRGRGNGRGKPKPTAE